MKSKEEFKERFTSGEFDNLLNDVSSPADVVKIASKLGYDLTVEDVLSSELNEDMLSSVAGGSGKNRTYYNTIYVDDREINGNGNKQANV